MASRSMSPRFAMSLCLGAVLSSTALSCGDSDSAAPPVAPASDAGAEGAADSSASDSAEQDAAGGDGSQQDAPADSTSLETSPVEAAADTADASDRVVSLWTAGDLAAKSFTDGHQGQTPSSFFIGISRFELLKAADDASPALVFDYGPDYVQVDMLSSTMVGYADLKTIPTGLYTHGRVKLDMTSFEVDTVLHPTVIPVPSTGKLSVLGALSDVTIEGSAHAKGWAQYTFSFLSTPFSQQATLPAFPSTGVGTIEETATTTSLLFAFPSAMPVASVLNASFKATLTMDEYQSFRWADQANPGYQAGKFDTEQAGSSEPVMNVGATGYHITLETQ